MENLVVKHRSGESYKITLPRGNVSEQSLTPESFWNESSAQQFVNNLVVSQGIWRDIIHQCDSFSTSCMAHDNIEKQVSSLIMDDKIKFYPVKIMDTVEHPPEKRIIKSDNTIYRFEPSSSLLFMNSAETQSFKSIDDAYTFLNKISNSEAELAAIAKELNIDIPKTAYSNEGEITDVISEELISGNTVIIVDRFTSTPSGDEKLVAPQAGPGNNKVDLGPHSSSPQQPDKTPKNIVAIREVASKSPTLTSNLSKLRNEGWKITKGTAGAGSYANKEQKTITIDANEFNNPASYVQTIAHESGHALYQADAYVPPNGLTRQEYIDANASSSLKDEGEATLMNVQIRDEILKNNGPDIGIAGTQGATYEKSYQNYQQHGDREKARTEIGHVFANNEVPSTTPDKTYKQYYSKPYEDHWDKNIKKP